MLIETENSVETAISSGLRGENIMIRQELKTFKVWDECPVCGGKLISDHAQAYMTYPVQYDKECENKDYTEISKELSPRIIYE